VNQRLFAIEMRTEIDRARRGDRGAAVRAERLARTHPSFFSSSHVTHNLGPARLAWCAARWPDLLGQYEPRSDGDGFLEEEEDMVEPPGEWLWRDLSRSRYAED